MKKRLISAGIMLLITLPILIFGGIFGGILFRLFAGIIALLGLKEFLELKGLKNYPKSVILVSILSLVLMVFSSRDILFDSIGLSYKTLFGILLLLLTPVVLCFETKKYGYKDAFSLAGFIIFFGTVLNILSNLYIYNRVYFFMIVLVAILTDTFAYITGMLIGKHKVTPISPKKSLEGFIGGITMGTILTYIYYITFIGEPTNTVTCILALIVLCIGAEIGDLLYSAIKREENIKDFSNLIPGHGGILDRIDSLTFITLVFVIVKTYL